MEVNLIIVLLTVVANNKTLVLQWVALHDASGNRLLDFCIELLQAADALLATVLIAPDRQRSTPETRTREVPVVQVLQPVAESTCTG